LILAAGRLPELIVRAEAAASQDSETQLGAWTAHSPYKAPLVAVGDEGLFSESDVLSDFPAAIKAIAAGRRMAASTHRLIQGEALSLTDNVLRPFSVIQNTNHVHGVESAAREIMPLCREAQYRQGLEIEQGFDEAAARREAARCLQCGLICYRHQAEATGDAPAEARLVS
jgi:hypothetical protein